MLFTKYHLLVDESNKNKRLSVAFIYELHDPVVPVWPRLYLWYGVQMSACEGIQCEYATMHRSDDVYTMYLRFKLFRVFTWSQASMCSSAACVAASPGRSAARLYRVCPGGSVPCSRFSVLVFPRLLEIPAVEYAYRGVLWSACEVGTRFFLLFRGASTDAPTIGR